MLPPVGLMVAIPWDSPQCLTGLIKSNTNPHIGSVWKEILSCYFSSFMWCVTCQLAISVLFQFFFVLFFLLHYLICTFILNTIFSRFAMPEHCIVLVYAWLLSLTHAVSLEVIFCGGTLMSALSQALSWVVSYRKAIYHYDIFSQSTSHYSWSDIFFVVEKTLYCVVF